MKNILSIRKLWANFDLVNKGKGRFFVGRIPEFSLRGFIQTILI